MNRRCTVLGTDSQGHLVLQAADSGWGTAPVPRPLVGSSTTGLHSCPPVGAQVLVLHEAGHTTPVPAAAVSASDALGTPPALLAGESALYGPNKEVLVYAPRSGPVILYKNAAGTIQLSIDPATGNLDFTTVGGGHITVNGVALTVP